MDGHHAAADDQAGLARQQLALHRGAKERGQRRAVVAARRRLIGGQPCADELSRLLADHVRGHAQRHHRGHRLFPITRFEALHHAAGADHDLPGEVEIGDQRQVAGGAGHGAGHAEPRHHQADQIADADRAAVEDLEAGAGEAQDGGGQLAARDEADDHRQDAERLAEVETRLGDLEEGDVLGAHQPRALELVVVDGADLGDDLARLVELLHDEAVAMVAVERLERADPTRRAIEVDAVLDPADVAAVDDQLAGERGVDDEEVGAAIAGGLAALVMADDAIGVVVLLHLLLVLRERELIDQLVHDALGVIAPQLARRVAGAARVARRLIAAPEHRAQQLEGGDAAHRLEDLEVEAFAAAARVEEALDQLDALRAGLAEIAGDGEGRQAAGVERGHHGGAAVGRAEHLLGDAAAAGDVVGIVATDRDDGAGRRRRAVGGVDQRAASCHRHRGRRRRLRLRARGHRRRRGKRRGQGALPSPMRVTGSRGERAPPRRRAVARRGSW